MKRLYGYGLFVLMACSISPAQNYHITHSIPLGGAGAWDYLKADVDARRLYVSHSSEVIVIDLDTQKQIGSLKGFGFIHGIVVVKQLNKGFLSDGQKNEVVTFDPATLEIKSRIKTASNPNSMAYDQHNGRLFVGHKPSKSITVIKAASDKIESRIELGGIPEFPVTDGKGNLYVNIDDQSQIVQIDTETLKIKARWPLDPCKGPSGLALDSEGKRLFAACDNRLMAVVNAETGKVITTLPIGDGPDAAGFDPQTKLAFSSNGDGTLTVVKELANDKYVVLQNLATESGARTMTVDTNTHAVYLSAAKLGPPPAPTPQNPNPPKHPTAIDGTFKVLVASPR